MKAKVYYVSPKGSAEKIAIAIADACKIVKEPLMPSFMPDGVTLMFLGCEGGKMDKVTKEFVTSLNKKRVAKAALFCTNPAKSDAAILDMKNTLAKEGIEVLEETFVCQGKGFFGKHPSDEDLKEAHAFAEKCVKEVFGG